MVFRRFDIERLADRPPIRWATGGDEAEPTSGVGPPFLRDGLPSLVPLEAMPDLYGSIRASTEDRFFFSSSRSL